MINMKGKKKPLGEYKKPLEILKNFKENKEGGLEFKRRYLRHTGFIGEWEGKLERISYLGRKKTVLK